jgi:type I restriction enzyme, S subunit
MHPGGRLALLDSLCVINPAPALEPIFLLQALRSPQATASIDEVVRGVALRQISVGEVRELPIVLPPLNEQRRIVDKLEALQARSRRAREALDAVPPLLEKLRQSILAAAFRGDLTKDWRAAHPNVEPATELLKRIRKERRAAWERAELAKLTAKGKAPTDDKWKAKYKEPDPVDTTDLPELPAGWCWARAEEVCDFITKGTTPSSEKLSGTGDIPFVKVYNLTFQGVVDFTVDPTFVNEATHRGELARSRVVPGDVLMNIVGPPLGKVGIVPDTFPEWNMNQAIAVFRVISGLSQDYLAAHLLSSRTVQWAVRQGKATAGQLNLTLEICRDLPVPLCSAEEQTAIAAALTGAGEASRRLTRSAQSMIVRNRDLESSVLASAFRGELVPQDPTDEPADAMLARIRDATDAADAKSIGPRKRTPRTAS